jgi:tetratricopeptide (TPR) repeat protein
MRTKILALLSIAALLAACTPTPAQVQAQKEKDPQYQYERAVVCMQYGIPDEAFKYLNQALALDPGHYLSQNLLGLAHMIKGNLGEAIKAFRACIALAPANFSEVYNNLGTALQESNQAGDAEAAFKKAFAIDQNYNASYNLAKIYFEQNKLEPALEAVRSSLQKYDRSLLAWNLEGLILENQERYDDAVACFLQALKIVPAEPNVSYNLASAYYRGGQIERAKEILEKTRIALEKTPPLQAQGQGQNQGGQTNEEVRKRVLELLKKIAEKK